MNELYFTADSPEVIRLASQDEKIGRLIEKIGALRFELEPDYFYSLVYAIVGQQLSGRVAATIFERVQNLCGGKITPSCLVSIDGEAIRNCGVSNAKISYLKGLAQKVLDGELNLSELDGLADSDILKLLIAIKGIGRWTAEMFLIFSLGRLDIFSEGDLGLRRAVSWLYQAEDLGKDEIAEITARWIPYRTIASLYLWEAVGRKLIGP